VVNKRIYYSIHLNSSHRQQVVGGRLVHDLSTVSPGNYRTEANSRKKE